MNEFFTNQPILAGLLVWLLTVILSKVSGYFWGLNPLRSFKIKNLESLNKEIKFLGVVFVFAFLVILLLVFLFKNGNIVQDTFSTVFMVLIGIITFQTIRIIFSTKLIADSALDLGVSGFDTEVKHGVDYDETLKLSNESIKFLGIGANKLVNSDFFESAITRCYESSGTSAEFVICDPNSPALGIMEKRNNKPEDTYSSRIRDSLRKIKSLKDKGYNISVKAYYANDIDDLPNFRVFISNSKTAYVSFYVIGAQNEEGRKLPQLHFSLLQRSNDMPTFFRAFNEYYNQTSNKNIEIDDFDKYLK